MVQAALRLLGLLSRGGLTGCTWKIFSDELLETPHFSVWLTRWLHSVSSVAMSVYRYGLAGLSARIT